MFAYDYGLKQHADTRLRALSSGSRWRRMVQYLVVFVGCVLVIDSLVGDKGVLQMLKKRQEARLLEQSLGAARAENARLRQEADRLRNDPTALEELARKDLGLIKPGEKLFILRDALPADQRPGGK